MKPESERFMAKAAKLLEQAQSVLDIGLYDAAGRTAYLAAFHSAQALIFERTGTICKTHSGVHAEFQRIASHIANLDPDLKAFLSRAYNLKAVADYETGPDSTVSAERARTAVVTAKVFVAHLDRAIGKTIQ